ncbi:MAG TPA: sialidase family protein, partial [Planctomycetaceae bacterium]|nr:sialidase family protein [Planctomycetaceae bacterium]
MAASNLRIAVGICLLAVTALPERLTAREPAAGPKARSINAAPPERVNAERFHPLAMPDGTIWGLSLRALAEGRLAVTALISKDNGRTWGDRRTLTELPRVHPPETVWGDVVACVDPATSELHAFLLKWDQTNAKAPFPKLGLWHTKSGPPYKAWNEPTQLFDGYIGGLLSSVVRRDGTIIAPFAYMTPRTYSQPASGLASWVFVGQHTATTVWSADRGATFQRSNDISVPSAILLGNECGAIEPVCLPLGDGRTWMLMRTQLGRLWESYSADGRHWSSARPSRFLASDSPASLTRLVDGRIVAIWNCCQRYPYAFGGRQVLHAAISADEGTTWDGFREVLRDPRRLEPALPIRGDYGTGYPVGAATRDKKLVFAAGQGATNGVFLLDPEWLTATQEHEDFEHGLESWSLYGTKGVELIAHPQRKSGRVLKLERTDVELPAAAVWNFPNGRAGRVR